MTTTAPSNHNHPVGARSGYDVATWLCIATLLLLHVIRMMNDLIHPDVAWYLYGSGRLLNGARLYHDVVDLNPPLIYALNIPAVWIARVLGVQPTAMYKAFMLVTVCGMLLFCGRILRQVMEGSSESTKKFALIVVAFLVVSLAGGNFWYIGTSFGQREHLMILFTMPYLFAALGRAHSIELSHRLRLQVGVLAGIGLAIKPHFILMLVMVEAYLFFISGQKHAWKRRETIIVVLMLGAYWILVAALFPEYLQLTPKVFEVYSAYNASFGELIVQSAAIIWVVTFIVLWVIRSNPVNRDARLLMFVAGTALLLVAILQRKGWGYQFYPARVALLGSLGFAVDASLERFERAPSGNWFSSIRKRNVIIALMLLGAAKPAIDSFIHPIPGAIPSLLPLVKQHAHGRSIMVFSTAIDPQFPLVEYAGVRWSSRYSDLWFLPHFYANVSSGENGEYLYHPPSAMIPLERGFYNEVITDLINAPPELLISNVSEERYPIGRSRFNFMDYYSMDSRFAELRRQYRRIASTGGFDIYERQPVEFSLTSYSR